MRTLSLGVNKLLSKVLTKDSVTVSVDAVVYYRVSNATVSVANVENAHHSTRLEELIVCRCSFILKVACSNLTPKHSGDKESSRDSKRPGQHLQLHAGQNCCFWTIV